MTEPVEKLRYELDESIKFAKWCIDMAACYGGKEYIRVANEARNRFPELKDYNPSGGPA